MTAYVIKLVTITEDATWIEEYASKVKAMVESHGGRYLARCPEVEPLEGDMRPPTIAVLLEFPDARRRCARNWHGSEEYKPWLESRQAGAKSEMLLIDAL